MTDQAGYRRALRVRKGSQKTLPIPVAVLAQLVAERAPRVLVEHLGGEMVQAIKDAPNV
jgi:hypothetical protein